MRLSTQHADLIRRTARDVLGDRVEVILFGSRADDEARGGDVDLLMAVPEAVPEAAMLSARLAARISRGMDGRKVDVVLQAPNLQAQAIHHVARQTGVRL